jgi:hypothetical protein
MGANKWGKLNNRRTLILVLGAGALCAPFRSFAQEQGKAWRLESTRGVRSNVANRMHGKPHG